MAFRITNTRQVLSSPEVVFDTLTDPTNRTKWCYGIREIRRLDDGPVRVGSRWLETGRNREAGLDETNEFTCTVADRPARFTMIMNGPPKGPPGGSFHWDFRLEPLGSGTRITAEFASNTRGVLGFLIRLGQKAFVLKAKEELDDFLKYLARPVAPT